MKTYHNNNDENMTKNNGNHDKLMVTEMMTKIDRHMTKNMTTHDDKMMTNNIGKKITQMIAE